MQYHKERLFQGLLSIEDRIVQSLQDQGNQAQEKHQCYRHKLHHINKEVVKADCDKKETNSLAYRLKLDDLKVEILLFLILEKICRKVILDVQYAHSDECLDHYQWQDPFILTNYLE